MPNRASVRFLYVGILLVTLLGIGSMIWPGWVFGHPVWDPWIGLQSPVATTTIAPTAVSVSGTPVSGVATAGVDIGGSIASATVSKDANNQDKDRAESAVPAAKQSAEGRREGIIASSQVTSSDKFKIGCYGKDVGAVQQAIGLSVVCLGTEYDAYTWRSVPLVVKATVPDGYIATLHLANNKIVVTDTPGQYNIQAATFRRVNGYPDDDAVHDHCVLLEKEREFGRTQKPSFDVEPMGFTCSGSSNTATTSVQPTDSSTEPVLSIAEVASWCNPDCFARLEQLEESDGTVNPAGVKLNPGKQCFSVNIPNNTLYDIWDGLKASSGQSATTLSKVCEASFRKAS